METLATLAMDVDVRSAEQATASLRALKGEARGVEDQFSRTGSSISQSAAISGTAAGQAQRTMKGLVEVYGDAFNAQGRYTHSAEANAAMMIRNAQAQAALVKEQERAARSAEALERRAERLVSSYAPFEGAIRKANREMAEANKLHAAGVLSTKQHAEAVSHLQARISGLSQAQTGVVTSTKAFQQLQLNTGRQLTDIGVQLAGGQNLLLILAQQLPQIADGFAVAKQQGLGFNAVMAGMAAQIAPILPILGAIGVAAGVVFGGAALAARALNDDNKNLAASLGLTEKQMARLKDKGVETGVTIGDVFKGTFNYIKGAVAPVLAPVAKFFDELFDRITSGAVTAIKAVVGGFAGAFAGIKAIWSDLPAVMGDLFASGANLAIASIEKLLNFATGGINKLIEKANAVSGRVGGPQLGSLGEFSLGRVPNANAGAATRAATDFVTAGSEAAKKAAAGVDKVFADIGKSITKAAADRIKKAAGDADKSPAAKATPRDMTDERTAQIAAQIEQATAEELRSRLAITREVSARASIERQIVAASVAAQQARVDAQIAAIADDKGLSDLKKAELSIELSRVKFIQGMAGDNQRMAITERERADLSAEALMRAQAGRQNQIDLLQSQQGLAQSSYQAAQLEKRILEERYQYERASLQATAANVMLKEAERDVALQRLQTLEEIHRNELKQIDLSDNMVTAMTAAINAIDDMARSFKSGDIGGGITGLSNAMRQASGILNGIEGMGGLGGTLGKIAGFLGPIGGLVSGVTSLFGGLFGGGGAKRRAREQEEARRQQEEAQRLQNIADTRRSLEISLLEAQGKTIEAVAARREDELAALLKLDPSLVDLQKQLYAATDAAEAAAKAAEKAAQVAAKRSSIQDQIDQLTLSSADLLAKARGKERAEAVALDPALGDLIDKLYGLQDAAAATTLQAEEAARAAADQEAALAAAAETARIQAHVANELTAAYERQAEAMKSLGNGLLDTIYKSYELTKSLKDLANELSGELGMAGQVAGYDAAKSNLIAGAKKGGDIEPLIRTFLEASQNTQSSSAGYQLDVAWARALALQESQRQAGIPAAIARMWQGMLEDQKGLPAFANGGSMILGGNPGIDQNVLSLNNQPIARVSAGEMATFTPQGSGSANDNSVAAELRALRQDFAQLLAAVVQGTVSTNTIKRMVERWDGGGLPEERSA